MHPRAGAALLELLAAAMLSGIVVAAAVLLLQTQNAVGRNITARSERNDAMRSAFATLRAELRDITAADLRAVGRDSIAARIFRGVAIVCGFNLPDVFVRYQGLRLPDVAKDSALQLGLENVIPIGSVRTDSSACVRSSGEQVLAIRWQAPARVGAAWLIFESGSYHLNTFALRYRQGGSARQPITNEVFDDVRSGFAMVRDSLLRAVDLSLFDRQVPVAVRSRLYLTNAQ
jgi:hypothetical protein